MSDTEMLKDFYERFLEGQEDLDPEIVKIIDENFEKLI